MPEPALVADATDHHTVTADKVVSLLGSDLLRGLDESVAVQRLGSDGPNTLPRAHGDSLLRRVLLQFHNPLIYVLLAAAATTLVLREYVDASVILAVVLVNALVGFIQESKALAALDSLRSMARGEARRPVKHHVERPTGSATRRRPATPVPSFARSVRAG